MCSAPVPRSPPLRLVRVVRPGGRAASRARLGQGGLRSGQVRSGRVGSCRYILQATQSSPWGWKRVLQQRAPERQSRASEFPALRSDGQSRLPQERGALPDLSSSVAREEAVRDLLLDVWAPSTRKAYEMKWRTIVRALQPWALAPLPPTREVIVALGAALKLGRYASAESYLVLLKTMAEKQGFTYTAELSRLHRDVVRSCVRGQGGLVKPLALPLTRLGELDLSKNEPWLSDGPMGPARCVVAGAWFMMREIELSCTRACLVEVRPMSVPPTITWSLPTSKNDTEARGVSRTLGCNCTGSVWASCP